MSIHRFTVLVFSVGVLALLGAGRLQAQAPPGFEVPSQTEPADVGEDAAARALRSLYVPDGLTSDQAVERVLAISPALKRTSALVLIAKGAAVQAMSGLVPRLDLQGRHSQLSPVQTQGLVSGENADLINDVIEEVQDPAAQFLWDRLFAFQFPALTRQTDFDATLSYSFTGALAQSLPAYRAAKESKVAVQYQIEAENNNVAFDGRQAYYEYARAEAGLAVGKFALDAAVSQRKETEALVGAGSAARVDLMRVQAQEEAARVAVEQANLGLQVAARTLQALMLTDQLPSLGEDLSEPVTGIPTGNEAQLQAQAYQERPDLLALRKYIDVKHHELRSANGGRAPDLLVRASAQYSNPNLRVVPQQERFIGTWEVGAAIRWSPNDTVNAQGLSRRLQGELEQAYADVTILEQQVRIDVARGYHGIEAAQKALQSARLGLNASREGYRVTREQLQAGIVNTTTLLQAQSELIRAQVDVVESAIGLRIAKATLLRAIGETP
ncbi:MAG: TolC family protein [Deltaproteobacteria bacterium]|nr:TolC family protein [Deltaproteobacteria bacterium]NND28051.1 TolC family protein [Myxococcales bacterium]MBT8465203.1 TolC family protein [Deltaproteobacteria bacterium]MBT8483487.1 TolC family protein [Deltaproteobacteria bacterium]NNK07537.1 TolC family protein [Myxococcales bacterium]